MLAGLTEDLWAQTIFLPGTPEVDQLVALYQKCGRVFPTTSFPVSKGELERLAAALQERAPDQLRSAIAAYRSTVLQYDPDHDYVSASVSAALEYYYRSQDVQLDPGFTHPELESLDVERLFLDRPPLVGIRTRLLERSAP